MRKYSPNRKYRTTYSKQPLPEKHKNKNTQFETTPSTNLNKFFKNTINKIISKFNNYI